MLTAEISVFAYFINYPLSQRALSISGFLCCGKAFAFSRKCLIVSVNSGVLRLRDGDGNIRDAFLVAPCSDPRAQPETAECHQNRGHKCSGQFDDDCVWHIFTPLRPTLVALLVPLIDGDCADDNGDDGNDDDGVQTEVLRNLLGFCRELGGGSKRPGGD